MVVDEMETFAKRTSECYAGRRPASRALFERLRRSLPGGETRSVTFYRPFPTGLARGTGPYVFDVDGHRYLDLLNNYTSLIHGHAFPPIVDAICAAAATGTAFPAPHEPLAELAQRVVERFPAVERVRFTNSGTEAALLALRIARHATGRRRVMVFKGGYHGTAPPFVDADPDAVVVPYNDVHAVEEALDHSVAAVFAEPFLGSGGVIPAAPGFLDDVGRAARAAGAVYVVDEVQSARNSLGGVHADLREQPDLILLGKIIGGGLAVGAVGGAEALMCQTAADTGQLAHSGTFNGNPATAAAGIASLEALDAQAISELNSRGQGLARAIESAARSVGLPATVTRAGSILHVHLLGSAPVNAAEAAQGNAELRSILHLLLLDEGIYSAPRGMLNLSTVLSTDHLEEVADAYARAFAALAEHA